MLVSIVYLSWSIHILWQKSFYLKSIPLLLLVFFVVFLVCDIFFLSYDRHLHSNIACLSLYSVYCFETALMIKENVKVSVKKRPIFWLNYSMVSIIFIDYFTNIFVFLDSLIFRYIFNGATRF